MPLKNPEWNNNQMRLFSETKYHLSIRPDGEVVGTKDDDLYTQLELSSAGISLVKIQGLETGLYLCFHPNGNLYGEANPETKGTMFVEDFQGSYSGFRSVHYPNWYVGLKKTGLAKNGNRTKWGQKAVKFLPRRSSSAT